MQKLKLGGKSYAPTEEHDLYPYNKNLEEFLDFMDKLHSKIEDEKKPEEAVKKVLASFRYFIAVFSLAQ